MPAEQYPDDWDERRREVYQRDGYECQLCHAQGGQAGDTELHAHHVTPISQGGSHDLDQSVFIEPQEFISGFEVLRRPQVSRLRSYR